MEQTVQLILNKIKRKNSLKLSSKEHSPHQKRLTSLKINYLEKDFKDFFQLLKEYQFSKEEQKLNRLLTKIYFLLEEDILKNLSFPFLEKNESNKSIINLFNECKQLIKEVKPPKNSSHQKYFELIETKIKIIETEIILFHNEEKSFKKIREEHHFSNQKEGALHNIHTSLFTNFQEIHEILGYNYQELMEKNKPSDNERIKNKIDQTISYFQESCQKYPELVPLKEELFILKHKL